MFVIEFQSISWPSPFKYTELYRKCLNCYFKHFWSRDQFYSVVPYNWLTLTRKRMPNSSKLICPVSYAESLFLSVFCRSHRQLQVHGVNFYNCISRVVGRWCTNIIISGSGEIAIKFDLQIRSKKNLKNTRTHRYYNEEAWGSQLTLTNKKYKNINFLKECSY